MQQTVINQAFYTTCYTHYVIDPITDTHTVRTFILCHYRLDFPLSSWKQVINSVDKVRSGTVVCSYIRCS